MENELPSCGNADARADLHTQDMEAAIALRPRVVISADRRGYIGASASSCRARGVAEVRMCGVIQIHDRIWQT